MLTGTIGLILLYIKRKTFVGIDHLTIDQWFLIFLTLFWLRQPASLMMRLGQLILHGAISRRGDEIGLADHLGFPVWSVLILTAVIGLIILGLVVSRFIPKIHRQNFLIAGLFGGIAGYILWLEVIGKMILP